MYETRCPIHGTIPFDKREKQIIDHPFCQRLRSVSQLGFASYVYMGATHNRLGHSLGVMHLAGRIFDRIVFSEKDWLQDIFKSDDLNYFRRIVRFAALLHDVGHPPFSHSFETLLPQKKCLPLPLDWYNQVDLEVPATHEDFSIAVIYALSQESRTLLETNEARDVCALIDNSIDVSEDFQARCDHNKDKSKNIYPLLRRIISGEIDADRMDYLLRDSHYAGVNYGKFDIYRMVQSLSCVRTENGIVPVLDHHDIHTYEDFLLARLHMFLQVYFHKTSLPFDHYLKLAFNDKEIEFEITGSLENFLMAREDRLLANLWEARTKKWSSRIVFRKLSKRLFQFEHYHPSDLQEKVFKLLDGAGIEYFFLQAHSYLSMLSSNPDKNTISLLVKDEVLGRTQYLPVQKVSLLLEQYNFTGKIRYLYCERKDFKKACEILIPLFDNK